VYANFLQLLPVPANQFIGHYDIRLVLLSYMVAVFASYIALDLTGRLRDHSNTPASGLSWLIGGALAMGSGIWSMHFIGMLSFTIPGVTLQYDVFWTVISWLVAVIASGFALYLLKTTIINVIHLAAGGIILGLAIASMHYTGMAAMLITLNIRYLPGLFLLSVLIAILASEAAIILALKSNIVTMRLRNRIKIASAFIMGLAICGMHYTGMAASIFTPICNPAPLDTNTLDPTILSLTIAAMTFLILGVAFIASSYKENINREQFEKARQLGMAEISATVLHNVGNVLNSVNVSAQKISEKNLSSQMQGLKKLCDLLNENKANLGSFITEDPRGVKTLAYLNKLAEYWHKEQEWLQQEINTLNKNLEIIKETISTQQNLSKPTSIEQIVSISELLEKALLITGFHLNKSIIIQKQYAKLNAIAVDENKLMQVVVNLLRNAKDALMSSATERKVLVITTSLVNNHEILIELSDNGIGVISTDAKKIFTYGFTTKKKGHGFGLHASILAINELGGSINFSSEGLEKGTTFSITLPYTQPRE
jgi:NO-binding membrane sensor protein with MHYT domain